jgi:NAD(P)-dependent dehydrogenase (short-subunit alcohol dehydrogenase family)
VIVVGVLPRPADLEGERITYYIADLADPAQVVRLAGDVIERFGRWA